MAFMLDDPIQRDPLDRSLYGTPYATSCVLQQSPEADVILARHLGTGEEALVKVVHLGDEGDDTTVEERRLRGDRLRLEHDILTRLAGPLFPEVLDTGATPDGRPYFVLAPMGHKTLATLLATRHALTIQEALTLVRCILPCLSAAHAAGIVHRNLRLENVWLRDTAGGEPGVWVLGFNLAKLASTDKSQLRPIARPTEKSSLLGGTRWAAPEVILGKDADERSDIYQVGLILFTLISGTNPFHARDSDSIAGNIVAPALSSVAPCPVSSALDVVVETALAVSPTRRYSTVAALAAALDALSTAGIAATERLDGPLYPPSIPILAQPALSPQPAAATELLPVGLTTAPLASPAHAPFAPAPAPTASPTSLPTPPSAGPLAGALSIAEPAAAKRYVRFTLMVAFGAALALILERLILGAP